jgi:hypothetical protein
MPNSTGTERMYNMCCLVVLEKKCQNVPKDYVDDIMVIIETKKENFVLFDLMEIFI